MRTKLAAVLLVVCSLFSLVGMDKAGAAYVVNNYNWWVNSRDHVYHVAADHWSDGSWHVTAHRYGYNGGGYQGWAVNQWYEDWACPQVFNGAPGGSVATVRIEPGYAPSHPNNDFCASQYGVYRSGSSGNNINWVTTGGASTLDWFKCHNPCILKAVDTGLVQDEPTWTDRSDVNGQIWTWMY